MDTTRICALVYRYTDEVWNRGKLALLDEFTTPDLVVHHGWQQPLCDREAERAWIRQVRTALPQAFLTIEDFLIEGERLALRWSLHTPDWSSGKLITFSGAQFSTLQNGKIAELWWIQHEPVLLQQLAQVCF